MFGKSRQTILPEDITDFLGELSLLLETGGTLDEAFSLISQGQEKPAMSDLLASLQAEIRQGKPLAVALAAYPDYFQPFWVDVLGQAEQRNELPHALAEIIRYREASDLADINLAERMKAALAYPAALLLITAAILSVLMIFVVPVFGDMFKEFGAELPGLTQTLIWFSDSLVEYGWLLLLPVFGIVLYSVYSRKTGHKIPWLAYVNAWLALHAPGLGRIYHYLEIARCLRAWDFMLAQNPALEKALGASYLMVRTPIYADTLRQMRDKLAAGRPLAEVLQQQRLFPKKVRHTLLIAERNGNARRLLARLADVYTQKARLQLEQGNRFFTLFLIIAIWLMIGFVVIAMYLPIFKMGQVI